MKVFDSIDLTKHPIELDGKSVCNVVYGKHCIWIPNEEMKIIWSYNGGVEAWRDWDKGQNKECILNGTFKDSSSFDYETKKSIVTEYFLMKALADIGMAPSIGKSFYIKNVVSNYPFGCKHCDSLGVYGYFIKDANKQSEKGKFDIETFRSYFVETGKVTLSEGAEGDLLKEDNIINGYLVDIRRTIWDMIILNYSRNEVEHFWNLHFKYEENIEELKSTICELSQFPHKQRNKNYQSYVLQNEYQEGSRDTIYRLDMMKVPKEISGYALDLGCNLGAICCELYKRGARNVTGVDFEDDYITCARALARANSYPINYIKMDLMDTEKAIKYFRELYPKGVHYVLTLSLYKHVGDTVLTLLDGFKWNFCFIESNNAPEGIKSGHGKEIDSSLRSKFKENYIITYIGQTSDRSPRCVWIVENLWHPVPELI